MKRLILTEEEKSHIKNLYNLVEQDQAFNPLQVVMNAAMKRIQDIQSGAVEPDDTTSSTPTTDDKGNIDTTSKPTDKLTSPLKSFVVGTKFGAVRPGIDTKRPHSGIDLKATTGTELFSPGDGKVVKANMGENGGCGGSIWINHQNGLESRFCHCSKIFVKVGDVVKRGQKVGLTGGGRNDPGRGFSTGAHLHYTLTKNGSLVDPLAYVDKKFYEAKSIS